MSSECCFLLLMLIPLSSNYLFIIIIYWSRFFKISSSLSILFSSSYFLLSSISVCFLNNKSFCSFSGSVLDYNYCSKLIISSDMFWTFFCKIFIYSLLGKGSPSCSWIKLIFQTFSYIDSSSMFSSYCSFKFFSF